MKKYLLTAAFVSQLLATATAQKTERISIVFYNVENLFDTINQSGVDDEEFTPGSEKQWTGARYRAKLGALASVLAASGRDALPAMAGLCEVENRAVVEDLVSQEMLKKGKYAVVHEDSPDGRGIDVALIYRKKLFRYIAHEAIPVALPGEDERPTRDILHVTCTFGRKDTLDVFVNHWPSRYGGAEASEPKRMAAAQTLRAAVDRLLVENPDAKVLIMGDFNDYPDNKSVYEVLNARENATGENGMDLVNLAYPQHNEGGGSYNYRGEWGFLDQVIVSRGLLRAPAGISAAEEGFYVVREDWMMYKDPKYGDLKPNRTYGGNNYYGGYSDHLPVGGTFVTGKGPQGF